MTFKPVSPKLDVTSLEEGVLKFWKQNQTFKKTMEQRQGAPEYVFFEGPPTANGKPGVHHVLARAFKDMFPRYKTMRGYHVSRRGGWDTHGLPVEIEVESVAECRSALRGKPEWIMLDNMGCDMMRECVALCKGVSKTEASGGITLGRAREVAATGVDAISLGCLTHSAPSVDLSLEWSVV